MILRQFIEEPLKTTRFYCLRQFSRKFFNKLNDFIWLIRFDTSIIEDVYEFFANNQLLPLKWLIETENNLCHFKRLHRRIAMRLVNIIVVRPTKYRGWQINARYSYRGVRQSAAKFRYHVRQLNRNLPKALKMAHELRNAHVVPQ